MIQASNKVWMICKVAGKPGQYVLARSEMTKDIKEVSTNDLKKRWNRGGLAFSGFFFSECFADFKVWQKNEKGEDVIGRQTQHSLYLAAAFHDWKTHENLYTLAAPSDFKALGGLMAQEDPDWFGDPLFNMSNCGSAPGYPWFKDTVCIGLHGLPVKEEEEAK